MSFWVLALPYDLGGALTVSKKAREKASVATALKPSAGRATQLSPKNSLLWKDTAAFQWWSGSPGNVSPGMGAARNCAKKFLLAGLVIPSARLFLHHI